MTQGQARKILTLSQGSVANWGMALTGGRDLRKLAIGVLCAATVVFGGCASKDVSIARVEGAEPQRLAFGKPTVVKSSFAEKMQACWFAGTYPMLGGYQYDDRPGIIPVSDTPTEVEQITISSGKGESAQVFVVQFSPFNDNTLIATRNVSFPSELATRMKHDVETWIFGRSDCGSQSESTPAVFKPNEAKTQQTQPQMARVAPDVSEGNEKADVSSASQVTLSRASSY
jgi:hypothetical protein